MNHHCQYDDAQCDDCFDFHLQLFENPAVTECTRCASPSTDPAYEPLPAVVKHLDSTINDDDAYDYAMREIDRRISTVRQLLRDCRYHLRNDPDPTDAHDTYLQCLTASNALMRECRTIRRALNRRE